MSRTRVKICGITRPEDARIVVKQGADALGLVFYPPSPRFVSIEQAQLIAETVPALVSVVGLFVDASFEEIKSVVSNVRIDVLQFHGNESSRDCERYGKPYLKAIRVKPGMDIEREMAAFPGAGGFLLDTYRPGVPGGTGETFDWTLFPENSDRPLILAGGLAPVNIERAINATHPYAVDVSGGVESTKGIKDSNLINQFFAGVNRVDADGKFSGAT